MRLTKPFSVLWFPTAGAIYWFHPFPSPTSRGDDMSGFPMMLHVTRAAEHSEIGNVIIIYRTNFFTLYVMN